MACVHILARKATAPPQSTVLNDGMCLPFRISESKEGNRMGRTWTSTKLSYSLWGEGDGGVRASSNERHWLGSEPESALPQQVFVKHKVAHIQLMNRKKKSGQHGGHFGAHTIYPGQGSQSSGGKLESSATKAKALHLGAALATGAFLDIF